MRAGQATSTALQGCYLLRNKVREWSHAELWKKYIQLTEGGTAFRVHATELDFRPVWHHREDRVEAHIFVCFLAYVLWKTLEQWTRRAGLGDIPRTALDELARIRNVNIVLPTTDGVELRVRCVVKPEAA